MQTRKPLLRKVLKILLWVVLPVPVLLILFASPIAEYLVEKYDKAYTGREIEMDWAYVNPFTGSIYFNDIVIHESNADSVFVSAEGLSANLEMLSLFSELLEIEGIRLEKPVIVIEQDSLAWNFDDLVKTLSGEKPEKVKQELKEEGFRVSVLDIELKDALVFYRDKMIPVDYSVKALNVRSPGKRWDSDTMRFEYDFVSGNGQGSIAGDLTIGLDSLDYRMKAQAKAYDLGFFEQYLRDLANYGSFSANLDADIRAEGNFKEARDLSAEGLLAFNDFHFGRAPGDDYASFDKLVFDMRELSPKKEIYDFDSLSLVHPMLRYEVYDKLDNLEAMFGQGGAKIQSAQASPAGVNIVLEIARWVEQLAQNFFRSDYKIDKLAVYKADLRFSDYSAMEKFSVAADPLYIFADSIDKDLARVNVSMRTELEPFGAVSAELSINPKDSSDFDLTYSLQRLPMAMFNPYLITHTSFPADRGTLEVDGRWRVRNGMISSNNHLVLVDPRLGDRVNRNGSKWLPMRLIMALTRERANVIDYEVPISGNLRDPDFHLRDVILDVLKNIFVKPATIPYRTQVRRLEKEIEKSHRVRWNMRGSELSFSQEAYLDRLAEYLEENPQARITVRPVEYAEKEKEYILFFEAKKKYFLQQRVKSGVGALDSLLVEKLSVKDSLFVRYLDRHAGNTQLFTVQQKCLALVGEDIVNRRYEQLCAARKTVFLSFFEKDAVKRIAFEARESTIPRNGFSSYRITYAGDVPDRVVNAYMKMEELNSEPPRDKYKRRRRRLPVN